MRAFHYLSMLATISPLVLGLPIPLAPDKTLEQTKLIRTALPLFVLDYLQEAAAAYKSVHGHLIRLGQGLSSGVINLAAKLDDKLDANPLPPAPEKSQRSADSLSQMDYRELGVLLSELDEFLASPDAAEVSRLSVFFHAPASFVSHIREHSPHSQGGS